MKSLALILRMKYLKSSCFKSLKSFSVFPICCILFEEDLQRRGERKYWMRVAFFQYWKENSIDYSSVSDPACVSPDPDPAIKKNLSGSRIQTTIWQDPDPDPKQWIIPPSPSHI